VRAAKESSWNKSWPVWEDRKKEREGSLEFLPLGSIVSCDRVSSLNHLGAMAVYDAGGVREGFGPAGQQNKQSCQKQYFSSFTSPVVPEFCTQYCRPTAVAGSVYVTPVAAVTQTGVPNRVSR